MVPVLLCPFFSDQFGLNQLSGAIKTGLISISDDIIIIKPKMAALLTFSHESSTGGGSKDTFMSLVYGRADTLPAKVLMHSHTRMQSLHVRDINAS